MAAYSDRANSDNDTAAILTCSVCMESIRDPRALPCGHSYCGPPETCLKALQKVGKPGVLTCALCNEDHRLEIADLKPLYGFRELLENHSSEVNSYKKEIDDLRNAMAELQQKHVFQAPLCQFSGHVNLEAKHPVQFWCNDCKEFICEICLEKRHSRHLMKGFGRYLKGEVSHKLVAREMTVSSASGFSLLN